MAVWSKAGRAAWVGIRGGRKLQDAAEEAEEADTEGGPEGVDRVETEITPDEGVLLVRYVVGSATLGWLEPLFLVKYALVALAALVAYATRWWWLVALLGIGFLALALVQRLVTRQIRRFGALRELEALDSVIGDASVAWWPNLRRELRRVGLPASPWGITKVGAGVVSRRLDPEDAAKFAAIDWPAVGPRNEWRRARQALAEVAASRRSAAA